MNYNGDVYCYRRPRELFPILILYNISIKDVVALTGLLDVDYHDQVRMYLKSLVLVIISQYKKLKNATYCYTDYVKQSLSLKTIFPKKTNARLGLLDKL